MHRDMGKKQEKSNDKNKKHIMSNPVGLLYI